VLGIDVIVKGNSILLPLKYTESVIDISLIEQNLRALVVSIQSFSLCPMKRLSKMGARGKPIDTPTT